MQKQFEIVTRFTYVQLPILYINTIELIIQKIGKFINTKKILISWKKVKFAT